MKIDICFVSEVLNEELENRSIQVLGNVKQETGKIVVCVLDISKYALKLDIRFFVLP